MSPGRRRLTALATGCVLAAALAVVLFAGVGNGSGGKAVAGGSAKALSDHAPGISPSAAHLMQLNVVPEQQAPQAPPLNLTDQFGRPLTMNQFKGKVVIWSLNDDQCTDLCPLFAQTVVAAEKDLGAAAKDVVFLPVNSNPFYTDPSYLRDWSERNDVASLPNWFYATGTPAELQQTWKDYKVTVIPDAKTRTVSHDAVVQFIDPSGRERAYGFFDEGALSTAYYAHTMAQMAVDLLPKSEQVKVGGPDVDTPATKGAPIGGQAPVFSLRPLSGTVTGRLGALDHKPLVLNFWSSTCSACTTEMPALQQVAEDFAGKVEVVGVDVADPRSSAAAFAKRLGAHYPLLSDPQGAVAAAYRVAALPVTFVIAPGGTLVARHDGALTSSELEAVLQIDFPPLAPG